MLTTTREAEDKATGCEFWDTARITVRERQVIIAEVSQKAPKISRKMWMGDWLRNWCPKAGDELVRRHRADGQGVGLLKLLHLLFPSQTLRVFFSHTNIKTAAVRVNKRAG